MVHLPRWIKQFLLLSLIAGSSLNQTQTSTQVHVESVKSFTRDVFKELLTQEDGNVFSSPLSAQIGLAMLLLAARGNTLTQLADTLHLSQDEKTIGNTFENFLSVVSQPNDDPRYNLTIANRVFIDRKLNVKQAYLISLENYFRAELGRVAFFNKDESVRAINTWVEEQTNNKIKDLLTPDLIKPETRMVLINTIYFLGKWSVPFPADQTEEKIFYKVDGTTTLSTMAMTKNLDYYEDDCLDAKFLRLPYEGNEIFMTIVLPNKKDGASSVFDKCCSIFDDKLYSNTRVLVNLPKFGFSTKVLFNDILQKLGAKDAFSDDADFTGVTDEMRLKIDFVLQQAFVNVTETGTEAAAATAIEVVGFSSIMTEPEKPKLFIADHPFVFFLSDKNGYILFIGQYSGV